MAFKLPDSSEILSVAILNLVLVVKTDTLSIVPKIVTSLFSSFLSISDINLTLDLSICVLGK